MRLAFMAKDGTTIEVQRVDSDIAQSAVATGPAAWSPADTHVALEIGLDEEPGVLLIDVSRQPSAVFVDRALASANVSGAGPQWDSSGAWLVFRTSGTGEWENEGIYAREIKGGAMLKLVAGVPRSMTVASDTLFVTLLQADDRRKDELVIFDLPTLLKQGSRVAIANSARKRTEKE
ncbi:MAG TPA: hypothetical protein VJZ00_00265 [Thermoanaerobaculia bacterium]|nr:hypothetical protein [Thermoanaerobaculia bacterium]